MRILVVTPFLPSSGALHGGGVLLGVLLEELRRLSDLLLLSLVRPVEARGAAASESLARRTVLIPHSTNADLAPTGLWAHRARLGWRMGARRLPLLAAKQRSARLARALAGLLREERPDVVFLEYGGSAQYLSLCRGFPTVLTDYEAGADHAVIAPLPRFEKRLARAFVRRAYARASLLQTLTPEDAVALREALEGRGPGVEVRPPAIPLPPRACLPERSGPAVAFFGNWSHAPNVEAARFLVEQVLPELHSLAPGCVLRLAGPQAPPEVLGLGGRPGVELEGFVPDLGGFLAGARCLVAPIFSGTGVRVKVLSALAHGLPVVTTPLGARGLGGAPRSALRQARTAREIAEGAAELLRDAGAAGLAGAAARRWVEEASSPARVAALQLERASRLLEGVRAGTPARG